MARPLGANIVQGEFSLEINQKEWDAVVEMANTLGPKIGQSAVSRVINDGTEQMLQAMKGLAVSMPANGKGNLSRNLKKQRKRKYEPTFWLSAIAVNIGKKRADGAFYWNIVEQGHRVVTPKKKDTGRRVEAIRWASTAFEMMRPRVLSDFARRVRSELERHWK